MQSCGPPNLRDHVTITSTTLSKDGIHSGDWGVVAGCLRDRNWVPFNQLLDVEVATRETGKINLQPSSTLSRALSIQLVATFPMLRQAPCLPPEIAWETTSSKVLNASRILISF